MRLLEKRFYAVPPQLLTTNGSANGYITIVDACILLKVKQIVNVTDTLGNLRTYEVKRIDEPDRVFLGPIGKPLLCYDDLSAYTTANGAFLFADEQQRTKIAEQEIPRAVYAEEPTVAVRSILVDPCGSVVSANNPLPVAATINISNVGTPTIFNVACATTGVEYSQIIPNNTAQMTLKSRNSQAKLQLAWIAGDTSSVFSTLSPGNIYVLENVKLVSKVVYFNSSKDNTIVEIVTWA